MASSSSVKASGSGNDRDVAIEAGNFLKELEVRPGSQPKLLASPDDQDCLLTLRFGRMRGPFTGRPGHSVVQAEVRRLRPRRLHCPSAVLTRRLTLLARQPVRRA